MERESRQHHQWVKDHPTESQTPSLLERLSKPKRIKKSGIPLQERLSDRLKRLLSRLGQGRPRNHKPYLRLVKSLPQNQPRMNNSNQTHSTNIHRPSIGSKPSLLNRMNVECESPVLYSENERMTLTREVSDMKHLTGIFPESHMPLQSTTSLTEYPMEMDFPKEKAIEEEDQTAVINQMMDTMNEDGQTRSREYSSHKCHGSTRNNELEGAVRTLVASKQKISSTYSKGIQSLSRNGLDVRRVPQPDSQAQSGTHSSRERQSISIPSSVLWTTCTALTKASGVLDLLRSSLEGQSQQRELKRAASGPLHSTPLSKPHLSSSPIAMINSGNMETTWNSYSQPSQQQFIPNCSNMTKQSDTKLDKGKISYSPIEENLPVIMKQLLPQTVLELKKQVREVKEVQERAANLEKNLISVIGSMERTDAALPPKNADTNTFAKDANRVDMERWTAKSLRECEELGRRPRYLRHNLYRNDEITSRSSAEWTEIAKPLLSVPAIEYDNIQACRTINRYPELFSVDTPINIAEFERLLTDHPNRLFVNSVVKSFKDGFWPWADTHFGEYPDTLDKSIGDPKNQKELDFICDQRDKEIEAGHFSKSFGIDLLPGMYSMPIHAVPKPHSTDLRLVTNHSAGNHSLNSMIKREDIAGFPLDNMTHLGEMLLRKTKEFPDEKLLLFKSDISDAYRHLPMHPLWQIKQVNTIQGHRHVDCRNCFGGKGSGSLFISFNSLVTWIGKNECQIEDLRAYSDDSFGIELAKNFTFYEPYNRTMPP